MGYTEPKIQLKDIVLSFRIVFSAISVHIELAQSWTWSDGGSLPRSRLHESCREPIVGNQSELSHHRRTQEEGQDIVARGKQ